MNSLNNQMNNLNINETDEINNILEILPISIEVGLDMKICLLKYQLTQEIKTLNKDKYYKIVMDKTKSKRSSYTSNYFNVFNYQKKYEYTIGQYNKNESNGYLILNFCGVCNILDCNYKKDGKKMYKGISAKELKTHCKLNGLKGYSKCKKDGLIKLLMTI